MPRRTVCLGSSNTPAAKHGISWAAAHQPMHCKRGALAPCSLGRPPNLPRAQLLACACAEGAPPPRQGRWRWMVWGRAPPALQSARVMQYVMTAMRVCVQHRPPVLSEYNPGLPLYTGRIRRATARTRLQTAPQSPSPPPRRLQAPPPAPPAATSTPGDATGAAAAAPCTTAPGLSLRAAMGEGERLRFPIGGVGQRWIALARSAILSSPLRYF